MPLRLLTVVIVKPDTHFGGFSKIRGKMYSFQIEMASARSLGSCLSCPEKRQFGETLSFSSFGI